MSLLYLLSLCGHVAGHLARRSSAAWGDDFQDAQAASDATMFYTNAVLQADTLNQDEWLALENYVKTLESDSTNKISVFSGPIYGDERSEKKFLSVAGHEPAEIPAAFFKVVVFIDRAGRLATRAFIMVQDTTLLSDKNGARSRMFDLQTFQVSDDVLRFMVACEKTLLQRGELILVFDFFV